MRVFDEYRAKRLAGYLSKSLHPRSRVLDLGCGGMTVAKFLRQKVSIDVIGLDVINVNKTSLQLLLGDGKQLPFADQSFDAVYAALVLHHTRTPRKVIDECLRVSRHRLIILEDVFRNRVERELLKALDWLGNRSISPNMPFPFTFRSEQQWLDLFREMKLAVCGVESIRPVPWRPTRHRMFVLERKE